MKAIWNGKILAESSDTVLVENNHYFPKSAIHPEYFQASSTVTHCPWKGAANYYSVLVDGDINKDAAWYYPSPSDEAQKIKGRVAFWRGVEVTE